MAKIPLMGCFEFIHYYKVPYLLDAQYLEQFARQYQWNVPFDLPKRAMENGVGVIITDLREHILWTSNYMEIMTGYEGKEMLGRSPKMLQGLATSQQTRTSVRQHINTRRPFQGTIHNYKKTGELYECIINIHPVFNMQNTLVHFLAFERQH